MYLGGLLVVCFGTFQHPALSHSCTQNSLTLLITDYTHHCIFSLVALVNTYIFCYSLSPLCLPLLRALSQFVTIHITSITSTPVPPHINSVPILPVYSPAIILLLLFNYSLFLSLTFLWPLQTKHQCENRETNYTSTLSLRPLRWNASHSLLAIDVSSHSYVKESKLRYWDTGAQVSIVGRAW